MNSSMKTTWLRWLHRSVLGISLAAPMAMMACAAPAEEDSGESGEALTGKAIAKGATLRVTASELNLRSRASAASTIIATMERDAIVTCAAASGQDGWVNVTTEEGKTGWAALRYLAETDDDGTGGGAGAVDGDTCSPDRAKNSGSPFEKALHDTIAHAEGTRNQSKDGYNVLFSGITVTSCQQHPNRCIKFGSTCSTAAGRYQFLAGTWKSIQNAKGYATFEPENQELAAAYLISSVRKATVPQDRALTAAEFENVMTKLSYEWASLPPGRYGQPKRTMSELRTLYCSLAGC